MASGTEYALKRFLGTGTLTRYPLLSPLNQFIVSKSASVRIDLALLDRDPVTARAFSLKNLIFYSFCLLQLFKMMLYRWHLLHTLNNFYFSLWDGKDKNLNLWCALPGLYGVSETLPLTVLWIRISIGFGFNGVPGFVSRSGFAIRIRIRNPDPEGQKWPTKVRDVLLWGLKASPVAWTSFREA
jgi:hypothetical protein